MDETPRAPLFSAWDLLPAAALGAVWLWLRHWLPSLPERVPSHWNAAGQVDGWMGKEHLFLPPLLLAGFGWALLFFIGLAFRSGEARKQAGACALLPLRGWLSCGMALMAGYMGPMAAIQGGRAVVIGLVLLFACLAAGLVPVIRAVRQAPPIVGASESDYRWGGMIYWNASDERLWVPKRLGIGWTLNFARPMAWVVMALLLILPLALAACVILATRR